MNITKRLLLISIISGSIALLAAGFIGLNAVKPQALLHLTKQFDASSDRGFRNTVYFWYELMTTSRYANDRIALGCKLNGTCISKDVGGEVANIPNVNEVYNSQVSNKAVIVHTKAGEIVYESYTSKSARTAFPKIFRSIDYDNTLPNLSSDDKINYKYRYHRYVPNKGAFQVQIAQFNDGLIATTYVEVPYIDFIASDKNIDLKFEYFTGQPYKNDSFINLKDGSTEFDLMAIVNAPGELSSLVEDEEDIKLVDGIYYQVLHFNPLNDLSQQLIYVLSIPEKSVIKHSFDLIAPYGVYALTFTLILLVTLYAIVYFIIVRPIHNLAGYVDSYFQNRRKPDILNQFPRAGKGEVGTLYGQLKSLFFELQSHERNIERYAYYDGMTGVLNRRSIDMYLDKQFDSDDVCVGLLLTDIDNFKTINDTFGHDCGDDAIRSISEILDRYIDNDPIEEIGEHIVETNNSVITGRVGRLGGDEFVIIVNSNDEAKLRTYIDAVMAEIRQTTFDFKGTSHKISLSVGIATADNEGNARDLKHEADVAMYIAKRGGKNDYEFYHPSHANEFNA